MQVTVVDSGKLRKTVTIAYTAQEVKVRRIQVMRTLAHQVRLDGFRPGKSPVSVVERRFGAEATASTEEQLADEGFQQALKENSLQPAGTPNSEGIERKDGGFALTMSFEIKPTIALPEAKSITLAPAVVEVSDAEVETELQGIARRAGSMSPLTADEAVIEDDSITVSGTIQVDGAEVRQLHDFNHLVGGYPFFGKAPAEVIAAFKGAKVGQTVAFTTTLPASFTPKEHAGKEASVSVSVQAANRLRAAELNDEFAKKLGVNSVDNLRQTLRLRLLATRNSESRGKQISELSEKLLASVTFELPDQMRANTVKAAVEDAIKGKSGPEAEKATAEATIEAEKAIRRFILMDALAAKLGIEVTNDDFVDQIRMAASHTGRNAQEIADQLKKSGRVNQVALEIREAKAIDQFLDLVLEAQQSAAQAKG